MTSLPPRSPAAPGAGAEPTLVARVEEFAAGTPQAPAVRHGDLTLTYQELDRQANRLAGRLTALGVRRGDTVAMHLGRSAEWVVGMLGCLKAGGVCMPLDPAAPAERFDRAIRAARPAAVIAAVPARRTGDPVPALPVELPVVDLDASAVSAPGAVGGFGLPRPSDLAFAMFTSGSSGAAKIVLGQHSWLASAAHGGITAADRGSWLGAPGAGSTLHEVSGLLWQGAEIVVGDHDVSANPRALRDWLLAERITRCFVVAPVAEYLQDLPWPDDCALRLLVVGGERLNRWGPADLPFEVANSYGSMEAFQVTSTLRPWHRRCTTATATGADRATAPPVGRPFPGVSVHVLEEDGLTPAGEGIGDVWIASDCLSLGYLGDPAQTADRFRPNPFGAAGSRLYRSGDLGRFRPDGILEHHGRVDGVVKVRGHRLELGEVEWVLGSHPDVRRVAVVVAEDGGRRHLVACFVGQRDIAPLELRNHAVARLPDYMVPVAYVRMAEFPLNTSNKVDRLRLPPADWARGRPSSAWRAPAPGVETTLARLFAELLRVDRVGADDHFLELGGDSLLMAQLQTGVERETGRRVEMPELMADPTVRGLAALLAAAPAAAPVPVLAPLDRAARREATANDDNDPYR